MGRTHNFDAEIMPFISSCNIACAFHSGSPQLIEQTIQTAIRHHVKIGAHPSYNDRPNFGRISVEVDRNQLLAELRYQICAVKGMVESFGQRLHHVKAHGALYNDMAKNKDLANDFVRLVKSINPNLKILTLAHSCVIDACEAHRMQSIHEGFADRRYQSRTQLRSRKLEGAVLHQSDKVLAQIQAFLAGKVQLFDGSWSNIQVQSLCLHSDTKGAVMLSKKIHNYLKSSNVQISATA